MSSAQSKTRWQQRLKSVTFVSTNLKRDGGVAINIWMPLANSTVSCFSLATSYVTKNLKCLEKERSFTHIWRITKLSIASMAYLPSLGTRLLRSMVSFSRLSPTSLHTHGHKTTSVRSPSIRFIRMNDTVHDGEQVSDRLADRRFANGDRRKRSGVDRDEHVVLNGRKELLQNIDTYYIDQNALDTPGGLGHSLWRKIWMGHIPTNQKSLAVNHWKMV